MEESEKIRTIILKNLLKKRKIGGSHTERRNAIKGFPPQLLKQADKEADWLIKNGFLLQKPSTGEIHVSINPKRLKEIYEMIGELL